MTAAAGRSKGEAMRIGALADTHGHADPRLAELFRGCELLLHAGDVGTPAVLAALRAIAPVRAVRGNNDDGPFGESLPEVLRERLDGLAAVVLHELGAPDRLSPGARQALRRPTPLVLHGHSHRPAAERREGTLFLNPGSAGKKRFSLPRSAALLTVEGRSVTFAVHDLDDPGLRLLLPPWRGDL